MARGARALQPSTASKRADSSRTPDATSAARKAARPGRLQSPTMIEAQPARSASAQRRPSASLVERR